MSEKLKGKILVAFSIAGGCLRSTAVTELACALARLGEKVLVIDADLINPTQHDRFSVHMPEVDRKFGLLEVIERRRAGYRTMTSEAMLPLLNGVYLLETTYPLTGRVGSHTLKHMRLAIEQELNVQAVSFGFEGSVLPALKEIFESARSKFDYILVDTSAGDSDLNERLVTLSDGVILPVSPSRSNLERGLSFLTRMSGPGWGWKGEVYPILVGDQSPNEHDLTETFRAGPFESYSGKIVPGLGCVPKLQKWFAENRGGIPRYLEKLLRHSVPHNAYCAYREDYISTEEGYPLKNHPSTAWSIAAKVIAGEPAEHANLPELVES